jgi:hypothetical protein
LLRISKRHGELADVVQQAADGQVTARGRGELELLADGGGELRHPAGVLLGGAVAALEADHQGAHARPEVGLLEGDEFGGAEVTDQRARRAGALDVQRGRHGHQQHGADLDQVPDPIGGGHRADPQVHVERDGQPGAAEGDREIGEAAGQQVGAHGANGQLAEEEQAGDQQADRRARLGQRHGRHRLGVRKAEQPEQQHGEEEDALRDDQVLDAAGAAHRGQCGQGQDQGAHRHREAAGQRDHAVHPDDEPGRGQRVHREQRGHGREGHAHQHRAAVTGAGAGDAQRERREAGDRRHG